EARKLRITVLDTDGKDVLSQDLRVLATQSDVLELRVAVPQVAEPETHAITRLAADAQINLPPELTTFLTNNNIRTLGDIRRAGGIQRIRGLPVPPEDPVLKTLQAHADLSRLSADVKTNAALIGKGFDSVAAIAERPLPEFVTATHDLLGDFRAA